LEFAVVGVVGLGVWFSVRAVLLGPLKPLGYVMLCINLLFAISGAYYLFSDGR
jgi:hypothetical protein